MLMEVIIWTVDHLTVIGWSLLNFGANKVDSVFSNRSG